MIFFQYSYPSQTDAITSALQTMSFSKSVDNDNVNDDADEDLMLLAKECELEANTLKDKMVERPPSANASDNTCYSVNDFVEMQNTGGGDCLFLAFIDAYSPSSMQHDEVRLRACAYMKQNAKYFHQFISEEYDRLNVTNFDEYIKRMENGGSWGGYPELVALCEHFKCNIIIYDKNRQTFTSIHSKYEDKIFLAYVKNGKIGHYTALIPVDETLVHRQIGNNVMDKHEQHTNTINFPTTIEGFGYAFNGKQ